MSNIAGKAYAMNLLTPIRNLLVPLNKAIFWAVGTPLLKLSLRGLQTLSMIHYARWVILRDSDFPRLSPTQPRERLRYGYMMFCSNFNGSWEQYVDSFAAAIPSGLNLLWFWNVGWPTANPEQPFHRYVEFNQVWTDYYYSAYPMAASNDVKSAQRVRKSLCDFVGRTAHSNPEDFLRQYHGLLKELQGDLGMLAATPIVSLAAEEITARRRQTSAAQPELPRAAQVARAANDSSNSQQPFEPSQVVALGPASSAQERRDAK